MVPVKHMAQAVTIIVVGAFAAWLAQVIPYVIRYDQTRSNE